MNYLCLFKYKRDFKGELMLNFFKEIFETQPDTNQSHFNEEQKIQVAACTLLIEAAKADSNYTDIEYQKVVAILKEMFSLDDNQVEDIMNLAEKWIEKSVSVYEFTEIINRNFSQDEKYELIKNIWKIVYSDNVLDKYEEHLVRIISNNLNQSHRDMIAAKLEAKEEFKKK